MNRTSKKPRNETPALDASLSPASPLEQPIPAALTGELCPPETHPRRGAKPGSPVAGPGRRGGKRGRKPSSYGPTPRRRRRRKLPPGRGAASLINSVNVILHDESDVVARALVDKTIAGNMASARLLVELACARRQASENGDINDGLSLADQLMSSGEWVSEDEWNRKVGSSEWDNRVGADEWNKIWNQHPPLPGESLQDFQERRLRYLPPPKPGSEDNSGDSARPEP